MSIFTGNFSMELKHPIDEKTWDIIADAEFDKTNRIWFETKSGKKVAFIKEDTLDKIRAEIEKLNSGDYGSICSYETHEGAREMKMDILRIIDKYKSESEE